jgi:hypothetical protein
MWCGVGGGGGGGCGGGVRGHGVVVVVPGVVTAFVMVAYVTDVAAL